jgi:aldehyde:ferredoxin oxidoreductase
MFGWAGKIISVDLTSGNIEFLDTKDYSDKYIGGLGIGQKLYWDMASGKADALDPDNPLILMTGPLAGTKAPSAPRLLACGKSPCIYPETFVNANMGGHIAVDLKKSGYDGIIIKGRAKNPVYLSIENETVEIKDAGHLWGLGNFKTREILHDEYSSKHGILSIGPAGESLTRFAILFTDEGSTSSMGFGAVMGSKNLKAITVQGTGKIAAADDEKIKTIRTRFKAMMGEGYFHLFNNPITLPGSEVVKRVHCSGCPQGCWRSLHRSPAGTEDIRKCQIGNFYMMWDKKLHGNFTEASFDAPMLANDFGVCALDMVFLLMWIDQCVQQGIITQEEAGLDFSQMGSREFLEEVLMKICSRDSFGEILSQGVLRASKVFGEKSVSITANMLTDSGRAIAYGPKVFSMSAIIYATEPRPFITELHEICEPLTKWAMWYLSKGEKTYLSTEVLKNIAKAFWGSEQAVDFSTYEGKALAAFKVQNRQYLKESLNLCDFAWPVYDVADKADHVGDPTLEAQIFSAVTGKEFGEEEYDLIGNRLFTLNRMILVREGRKGRESDVLPDFMFIEREEMIADVFGMYNPGLFLPGKGDEVISRKGKAVDKKEFEKMMDEYYLLRGWDVQTGLPEKETLQKLGLDLPL